MANELEKKGRIYFPKKIGGVPAFIRVDEMAGVLLQDIWTDIPLISSQAKERLSTYYLERRATQDMAKEIGNDQRLYYIAGDVSQENVCTSLIQAAVKRFGRLDV
jgi:NAD(P)-dependent dehydrogenase (short-subunit alcohol dehydrogenase family)